MAARTIGDRQTAIAPQGDERMAQWPKATELRESTEADAGPMVTTAVVTGVPRDGIACMLYEASA